MKTTRTLLIIALLILIITASLFILGQRKDATLLTLHIRINTSTTTPTIENITAEAEQVNKLSLPKGGPLFQPGITVIVIRNQTPISDWTSRRFNGTSGDYEMKIGLHQQIQKGDTIRIVARIINEQGEDETAIATDITV